VLMVAINKTMDYSICNNLLYHQYKNILLYYYNN